jgi:hypothetical protein
MDNGQEGQAMVLISINAGPFVTLKYHADVHDNKVFLPTAETMIWAIIVGLPNDALARRRARSEIYRFIEIQSHGLANTAPL